MRKGAAGTHALNKRLQNLLNPPAPDKAEWKVGGTVRASGFWRGSTAGLQGVYRAPESAQPARPRQGRVKGRRDGARIWVLEGVYRGSTGGLQGVYRAPESAQPARPGQGRVEGRRDGAHIWVLEGVYRGSTG
eukprot:765204-Prorocentrum_minimum.AAC.1